LGNGKALRRPAEMKLLRQYHERLEMPDFGRADRQQ
jgi:hypothetical protein